ncbi:hypothetical protein Cgig2_004592 [Carnegiea gigantea]|uniref:Uncharacterized protein n=1 Tax=Carnegiea gigantea TaxID=171969 RepID=A0A9Q1GJ90_9CARY|nr:hypothetical protein Cgig2_004592 [Carnegiea gigantea]
MSEFILAKKDGGESFNRNLVNCFFSGPKNRYYSKSILKYVKDVSQITSLGWCQFILEKLITSVRHYKESKATKGVHLYGPLFFLMVSSPIQQCSACAPSSSPILPLHKPDNEAQIPRTILVANASVIIEKEDHHEDVLLDQPNNVMKKDDSIPSYSLGLGLSQPDSQSPVPQTTSMPDPNTAGKRMMQTTGSKIPSPHNAKEPAQQSKQALSSEAQAKAATAKGGVKRTGVSKTNWWGESKVISQGEAHYAEQYREKIIIALTAKQAVEQKKGSLRADSVLQATNSSKPNLIKEVLPEKNDEKRVDAIRTPKKLEDVGPSDALRKRWPKNLPLAYYSLYVI